MLPLLNSIQTKWTSTVTSRFCSRPGYTLYYEDSDERFLDWVTPDTYAIDGPEHRDAITAPTRRARNTEERAAAPTRLAASYVTGSHALQTGMTLGRGYRITRLFYAGDFTATFRDNRPINANLRIPTDQHERIAATSASGSRTSGRSAARR